ncbi:hypothetical protein, partial [Lysinibacillus sp. NPDC096212]|uniref:hypothetical protein n=1 Tax=Lysinibacillus sp. NPDC096212 TaxID=3364135 RepID=UPI00382832BD
AFAQKTFVADATLSHKKHLLLTLRFRTKNICYCRCAFAQKTFVGPKPPADVTKRKGVLYTRFLSRNMLI